MRDVEHRLQVACKNWYRLQYNNAHAHAALFAIPNGGARDAVTGARLKSEGALAGVADMILLKRTAQYGALLIEFKTAKGRQSTRQKWWEENITYAGEYKYIVVRSLRDFQIAVTRYLMFALTPW